MERMGLLAFGHRMRRSDQGLPDHLPAEHAPPAMGIAGAAMEVGLHLLDIQQGDESRNAIFLIRH
jgi:hypothetical protein